MESRSYVDMHIGGGCIPNSVIKLIWPPNRQVQSITNPQHPPAYILDPTRLPNISNITPTHIHLHLGTELPILIRRLVGETIITKPD